MIITDVERTIGLIIIFTHFNTQDDDSGHKIRQEPAEICGKNHRILKEKLEITGRWKQYSRPEIFGFFPVTCGPFRLFPSGNGRKLLEKILKFPGRNIASIKSPKVLGTGRFLTGFSDLATGVASL